MSYPDGKPLLHAQERSEKVKHTPAIGGFAFRQLLSWTTLLTALCMASVVLAQEFVIEGKRVAEIRVIGNKEIPTESILGVLKLEPGMELTTEAVDADKKRIMEMGFFYDVQVQTESTQRGIIVTIVVFENPLVQSIEIKGNEVFASDVLLAVMKTKPGSVLNNDLVKKDVEAIQAYYRKQGYLVEAEDVNINKEGVLTILLREAVIESIVFPKQKGKPSERHGLFKTRENVVRREMMVKPGDKFNSKQLQKDMNRIFNLGLFEDLRYELKQGSKPGNVIVEIIAKEKKTGTAAVGLGFSSRSEIVGFVDLTESNFKGKGEAVAFRGEAGDRRSYEVSYAKPWLDAKRTSMSVSVYDRLIYREPRGSLVINPDVQATSTFEERRKGGRIGFSRPLKKDLRTRIGLQVRNEKVSLIQTETTTLEEFRTDYGRIMGIAGTWSHDTRDIVFDPTKGGREAVTLEYAGKFLGGESTFTKLDVDLRRYRPFFLSKTTFAARLMFGLSLTGAFPPFEQYFVGGSDTIRGYDIDHDYGDAMAIVNLELRRRVQKNIQAVAFVDYGDAWGGAHANSATFEGNLGYGLGVRLNTPVGPIRLDYGIGSEGSQVHFSIGQAF